MKEACDQARLGSGVWKELERLSRPLGFLPGEILQHEHAPATRLFLIESGCISLRLCEALSRRLVLIDLLGTGDVVNAETIWIEAAAGLRAEALRSGRCHVIDRDTLAQLMRGRPEIVQQFLQWLAEGLQVERGWLTSTVYGDSGTRLSQVLWRLAKRHGQAEGLGLRLQIPLRRKDIAEMAGVSTETAVRLLGQLRRRGLVQVEANSLFVPEPARLQDAFGSAM
jgi:CRP/FNR family transcriptional regulator